MVRFSFTDSRGKPREREQVWARAGFIRLSRLEILGRINRPEFVPILLPHVTWNSSECIAAAEALLAINTPEAVDTLMRELPKWIDREGRFIRRAGASLMGEMGEEAFIPTLAQLLADPEDIVRNAAIEALQKIGTVKALALL